MYRRYFDISVKLNRFILGITIIYMNNSHGPNGINIRLGVGPLLISFFYPPMYGLKFHTRAVNND